VRAKHKSLSSRRATNGLRPIGSLPTEVHRPLPRHPVCRPTGPHQQTCFDLAVERFLEEGTGAADLQRIRAPAAASLMCKVYGPTWTVVIVIAAIGRRRTRRTSSTPKLRESNLRVPANRRHGLLPFDRTVSSFFFSRSSIAVSFAFLPTGR
jgi:hypothetical protein